MEITDYNQLLRRIEFLKIEKKVQEEELHLKFKSFTSTLEPISIIKKSLHDLASDTTVQEDVTTLGLNTGVGYVVEKVMGRTKSVKGFLSSILVEKFVKLLIKKSAPIIVSGITNYLETKKSERIDEV